MRPLLATLALPIAMFGLMQLVRYPRTNPPVRGDLSAPAPVKTLLRRACYGCHSNETRWPWFSAIAPASWLTHYDVAEARRRLNFSEWSDYAYDPGTKEQKLKEMANMIASDAMPPWYYRAMRPNARLSDAAKAAILRWIAQERGRSR